MRWMIGFFFLIVAHTCSSQRILDSTGRTVSVSDTAGRGIPVDSLNQVATPVREKKKVDSVLKVHSPRKAIIRSAILPGWGQIYNKKYWKLPLVYGALGTTAYVFIDNISTYRELRFAYRARFEATPQGGGDSTNFRKLASRYTVIPMESIRNGRDQFRRYIDYSVLFFVFFWGLNVVDAAVDGHLKSFDVSPELSLRIKPGYSEMAGTKGISIVLAFK